MLDMEEQALGLSLLKDVARSFSTISLQRQDAILKLAAQDIEDEVMLRQFRDSVRFMQQIRKAFRAAVALSSRTEAESNTQRRSDAATYYCPFQCGKRFQEISQLKDDLRSIHCKMSCGVCDESFDTKDKYSTHYKNNHHRDSKMSSSQAFIEWDDKERRYAYGCGICQELFILCRSNEYVVHVLEHYKEGKTTWSPTLHIRALLSDRNISEHWRAILDGTLANPVDQPEQYLRWDAAACKRFDGYLQRNAAPEQLRAQLPRLLVAGLEYAIPRTTPGQQQDQTSSSQRQAPPASHEPIPGAWPSGSRSR